MKAVDQIVCQQCTIKDALVAKKNENKLDIQRHNNSNLVRVKTPKKSEVDNTIEEEIAEYKTISNEVFMYSAILDSWKSNENKLKDLSKLA